jgi:hypothetical protein
MFKKLSCFGLYGIYEKQQRCKIFLCSELSGPDEKQQSCKIFVGMHLENRTIGAEHRNI